MQIGRGIRPYIKDLSLMTYKQPSGLIEDPSRSYLHPLDTTYTPTMPDTRSNSISWPKKKYNFFKSSIINNCDLALSHLATLHSINTTDSACLIRSRVEASKVTECVGTVSFGIGALLEEARKLHVSEGIPMAVDSSQDLDCALSLETQLESWKRGIDGTLRLLGKFFKEPGNNVITEAAKEDDTEYTVSLSTVIGQLESNQRIGAQIAEECGRLQRLYITRYNAVNPTQLP
jgi:hypothetical protein